jgi:hypothetical protein
MSWSYYPPKPPEEDERPPDSAEHWPLGTVAVNKGVKWTVEWDNQDHRHVWVTED